ncbi:MAG: OmpA family protein [Deltaproteobacteria bacterium]|nr:OmpA family protein [Deltaproteobacteria bacterium]
MMDRAMTTRKNRWVMVSILFLVFVFSGCVGSSKYKTLESQYAMLQEENRTVKARNMTLNEELTQVRDQNAKLAQQKRDQEAIMNSMMDSLKTEVANKSVQISLIEDSLKIKVVEKLFFNSGSAEITRAGRALLAHFASTLKEAEDQEILVIGHADQLPPGDKLSDQYPSNWELSTARATAIVQVLQWGYGIDPKRLIAAGVAHYRPAVMETNLNRATNRFVEIVLTRMKMTDYVEK